ncbi:MAG: EAL domain-containing protein [Acidobacteriota bacterium]|nr:EAL domain-containing protein [Acidobacteriota bacterium]
MTSAERPSFDAAALGLPQRLVSPDDAAGSYGPVDEHMKLILDSVPHVVWTASADGVTTSLNRRGITYTGRRPGTCSDGGWLGRAHPDDRERAGRAWAEAVVTGADYAVDYRFRRFDGVYRWHAFRAEPVRGGGGEVAFWIGTATDVDDQRSLEMSLRQSEMEATQALALLESIGDAAPVGFKLVDRDLRIVRINQRLADVDGRAVSEQVGRTVAEAFPDLWPDLEDVYQRVLAGEEVCDVELTRTSAASPRCVSHFLASYYPVRIDGEIIGVGNVVLDITERKDAETFRQVVMDNMAEGLYTLDSDGLVTYVNPAACRMLGWTEQELRGQPMHQTIHFQDADHQPIPAGVCPLLEVRLQGRTLRGSDEAFTRRDGTIFPVAFSSAPLLSEANITGLVVVFRDITEEKKEQTALRRELAALTWVGRIRDALDEDRLVLYSQPIVPLGHGRPTQELLLRLVGRDGELIAPGEFLPPAEKYGLIAEIDRWVVSRTVELAATGQTVECNLSAASLESPGMLSFIEQQIARSGAAPADLVFEITETALMTDLAAGEEFAHGLAKMGCGLAIDDFGTGFGSLLYLKKLPITVLKIDREFIHDLPTNPANRHVVDAIVSLARAFNVHTVAEGIEDQATLDCVQAAGVDYGQGYHLGRPAPTTTSPASPHPEQTAPGAGNPKATAARH